MRRPSIALALLLVAPLASAQVYKWTDAQGTTHYSETPPASGTKYSQVSVSSDSSAPASSGDSSSNASSTTSIPSSPQGNGSQPTQQVPDTPQNRATLCASLKTNIGTLQGDSPVVMQGTGGQSQLLNDDERKQQLSACQSQYQQYCSG